MAQVWFLFDTDRDYMPLRNAEIESNTTTSDPPCYQNLLYVSFLFVLINNQIFSFKDQIWGHILVVARSCISELWEKFWTSLPKQNQPKFILQFTFTDSWNSIVTWSRLIEEDLLKTISKIKEGRMSLKHHQQMHSRLKILKKQKKIAIKPKINTFWRKTLVFWPLCSKKNLIVDFCSKATCTFFSHFSLIHNTST